MRFLLVTALVLLAVAAPAQAVTGSFEVPRLPGPVAPDATIPVLSAPEPVGDAVAYAVGTPARGFAVRLQAPAAVATTDVAAIPPEPGSSVVLHASPSRLVAVRHAEVCYSRCYGIPTRTLDAILAGPLLGPLSVLGPCGPGGGCAQSCPGRDDGPYVASLDGDLLGVLDGCTQTAGVRNLATGTTVDLGRALGVAVAGRFAAIIEPPAVAPAPTSSPAPGKAVVIRDASSGAQLYRAGISADNLFGTDLALLADGTAIYSTVINRSPSLVVASPAAPAGRVLRTLPPFAKIVGAGPGVVLLGAAASLPAPNSPRRALLALVRLDTGASQPVGPDDDDIVADVGFDGRTIAWARRRCVTTVVTTWRLGDPMPAAADLRCPTAIPLRRTARLTRGGRISVALVCPGSARGGCLGTVRLTAVRGGRLPRGANGAERFYVLGTARVALDPGERASAVVLVGRGAARWVRRHAPMRLEIVVRSERERRADRPRADRGVVARTIGLRLAR